jgi:vWA-MoxR associated protein C-terminal domain
VIQNLDAYTDAKDLDLEAGIPDHKIPVLLAIYLDQVGSQGIDLQGLTVELLLPLALMNVPLDQHPIPAQFGLPQPLARDCHVVVRSQERLEGYRAQGRWQAKWQQLQALPTINAGKVFVPGTENLPQLQRQLSQPDKLGLKLNRSPSTGLQGELGILLGTGAPIALWVRQENAAVNWENLFARQVFCCLEPDAQADSGEQGLHCCIATGAQPRAEESGGRCRSIALAALPQRVSTVRQDAPDIDEESSLKESLELGHHLSFLWEDPKRVPPKMTYSTGSL